MSDEEKSLIPLTLDRRVGVDLLLGRAPPEAAAEGEDPQRTLLKISRRLNQVYAGSVFSQRLAPEG